jgi:hypothetical protein
MFWSSILCLTPPQLYERVGKWTHEPRSNFNHKKHLSSAFTHTFIFSIILFRKYENIFTLLTQPKPKNTFTAFYKLHISLVYLSRIIFILLTYTPCAWQPLGGVGDTRQWSCFAGCLKKNDKSFFDWSPRVLNPKFPLGDRVKLPDLSMRQ